MSTTFNENVGIGTATPVSPLDILKSHTTTTNDEVFNFHCRMVVAPTGNLSPWPDGLRTGVRFTTEIPVENDKQISSVTAAWGAVINHGSGNLGSVTALVGDAANDGGSASAFLNGASLSASLTAGSSAQLMYGLLVENQVNTSSEVTESMYGVSITQNIEAGSTVENRYGLYIGGDGAATTEDFGVYAEQEVPNYFAGNVGIGTTSPGSRLDIADGALTIQEMTAPSAPSSNKCIIYAEDNGSGKTRLMVRFATGAAAQLAIEP